MKILIEAYGKKFEFTIEEAKEIHKQLDELFPKNLFITQTPYVTGPGLSSPVTAPVLPQFIYM